MTIEVVGSISAVTLGQGALRDSVDRQISEVLQQWWQLEADGWVRRGAYDIRPLVAFWRSNPYHPEARRLLECLSLLSTLREGMPNGLEDANNERMFHSILQLMFRPRSAPVKRTKYDQLLEFSEQLTVPIVIERYDQSFGEYSNAAAGRQLYQGRNSVGVTAHELFIPQIADVLVTMSHEAKHEGQAIVTVAANESEHWNNLRIPVMDEKGRMRSYLIAQCVRTLGADNSWMFNDRDR